MYLICIVEVILYFHKHNFLKMCVCVYIDLYLPAIL